MKVSELVGVLGFEYDEKNLNKFEEGLKTSTKLLAVICTAIAGAGAATFAFVNKIAEQNDALGKMSETLGMSVADLQEWQYAAQLGGGSAEGMSSSLQNLARMTSQAALGMGQGVQVFGMLGISATDAQGRVKGASQMMSEVADKISKMSSQSQKIDFLNQLGISPDMLLTLEHGSKALKKKREEAQKLGFILSKKDIETAAKFDDALLKLHVIIKGMFNSVATKLMPTITKMMDLFKEWFVRNKEIIKQNLTGFLDGVITAFKTVVNVVTRVVNVINAVVQAVGGWENALIGLGSILTIINAKILLMPVLLTALAAVAFLVIEDLVKYFQHADSVTGDLVKKFPLLGKALHAIADVLKIAIDGWKLFFSQGDKALEGLGILIDRYLITPLDNFIKKIESVFKTVKDFSASVSDSIGGPFDGTMNFLGLGDSQMKPQMVTSRDNRSTIANNNTFTADIKIDAGGGDPKVIAQHTRQELNRWFDGKMKQSHSNVVNPIKG